MQSTGRVVAMSHEEQSIALDAKEDFLYNMYIMTQWDDIYPDLFVFWDTALDRCNIHSPPFQDVYRQQSSKTSRQR
jgi:hypothetical protein